LTIESHVVHVAVREPII